MNGLKKKGEEYFNKQIDICKRLIESGRVLKYSWRKYYDLAGAYACKGEEEKAFENLRIFNKSPIFDKWLVVYIKNDPFFDSLSDESEFQQIARDVEARFQAEH